MKTTITITALSVILVLTSCVQKTHQKTIVFSLNTPKMGAISKVGIKGKDKPFSWDYATEMKTIKKDCLYELTTTFETGYNGTEIKFVVNDSLEFEHEENRRIKFAITHTTFYNATFNAR